MKLVKLRIMVIATIVIGLVQLGLAELFKELFFIPIILLIIADFVFLFIVVSIMERDDFHEYCIHMLTIKAKRAPKQYKKIAGLHTFYKTVEEAIVSFTFIYGLQLLVRFFYQGHALNNTAYIVTSCAVSIFIYVFYLAASDDYSMYLTL
jgi:hypothetical protein